MGVKYVKDFSFPTSGGFHGSNKMPSKARASERGMPAKVVRKADGGMLENFTTGQGMDETAGMRAQAPIDALRGRFSPGEKEVIYRAEPVRDDGLRLPPMGRAPVKSSAEARAQTAANKQRVADMQARAAKLRAENEAKRAASAARVTAARSKLSPATRVASEKFQSDLRAKALANAAARRAKPTPVTSPILEEPMYYKKGGEVKGKKIAKVMREYKKGELHSGKNGPVVKNPKQAMAIALSEARRTKKAEGGLTSYEESGSAGGSNVGFKEAFRKAREQGLKEFSWRGDRYSTKLREESSRESKVEDKAPKAEMGRKGPESRGGKRNVTEMSEYKRERKMELPSDRGSGFRSQAEETGMSASERAEKARGYAENLMNVAGAGALLRKPLKEGAKSLVRKGMEFVGGRKMKKEAAETAARKATPEYKSKAAQMEKFAEQMRARQKMGARYAEGGEVDYRNATKLKNKGIFNDEYMAYKSKGPSTRYTAAKGRKQAKERAMERWAEQRMRHAEQYAPGKSLDMSEYKKGGKVKHSDVKMDKAMVKKAVHKHERAMHPGKPMTKLRNGGVPSYGRKPMYGGGKC